MKYDYSWCKFQKDTKPKVKTDKVRDNNRFSIIVEDLAKCIECGFVPVEKHEIFGGNKNRENSKKYGLVIPLCKKHHNLSKTGIHNNVALRNKWQKKAQKAFEKEYKQEDFKKIFGKNYL